MVQTEVIPKNTKMYQILHEIDRHGIMTKEQILERVDTAESNVRKSIQKLEMLGFVKISKLYKKYCYYVTQAGSSYIGNIGFGYTQSSKEPNTTVLQHNLKMVDASLGSLRKCCRETPHLKFQLVTEREHLAWWYQELEKQYTGRMLLLHKQTLRKKIPDYVIRFEKNGENYAAAYELELTKKSQAYLQKKLMWYKDQFNLDRYQVLYYVCEEQRIFDFVETNATKIGLSVYSQPFATLIGGTAHES